MGNLPCMGLFSIFLARPDHLGRRVDVADDRLPALGDMDVLNGHLLLALRAVVFQTLNLHRKCARKFVERALGGILLRDIVDVGEPTRERHRGHMHLRHLRREHRLDLVARINALDHREHEIRSFFRDGFSLARVHQSQNEPIREVDARGHLLRRLEPVSMFQMRRSVASLAHGIREVGMVADVSRLRETSSTTVRDAVIDLLRRFSMTSIFANPGSTELPLFRGFPEDFRYVLGLQEAVVVGMADGYAQATRNAAFVNLHSAAGVGNAMGNIFTAFKNKTPLVVTAGQQARSILPYEPFLAARDATELPKPYVKWSVQPVRAADVPLAIARAYYVAMTPPRGPVFVSIPVDDWDQPAELVPLRIVSREIRPDPDMIERIGALLDSSARPAFVLGGAIDRDDAWREVVKLAEAYQAKVWTAPMTGRGCFPEDHPLFAGFLPPMRERIVDILSGHDAIFAIGAAAFTYHVEGWGPHIPAGARLCQLTEDPDMVAWTPEGLGVVGGVRLGLLDLLARPMRSRSPIPPARAARPRATPSSPMTTAFVLQTLSELRDADDVIVEEAPSARSVMQAHLPIRQPNGFYTMDSGGLGYSMPAAVGIALGRPGQRIIAIIGDGSSLYSIQALWSAAQFELPIIYVILNNGRYAALQDFAPVFGFNQGEAVQGTNLPGIDFVSIARGFGCEATRVTEAGKLAEALAAALAARRPMLVDVVVA